MRIKLINHRKFFDEVLKNKECNLRQLSQTFKMSYSPLKKYRRGDLLIPERIFNKLNQFSSDKNFWINNSKKFDVGWGASKAGKISTLKDKGNKRIAYARKFIKLPQIKIKINEFFCEFYGALLGDGCISKFQDFEGTKRTIICISGNKMLDSDYLQYLKSKLKSEFNINSYFYKYKNRNMCLLTIKNKKFSLFLGRLGFPTGIKYNKIKIPDKIMRLPWNMQKMTIRGIFDTDGSLCAKKREKYKYPQICLTSTDTRLLNQAYNLLKGKGYPCWKGGHNIFIRSNSATKRWFKDIGSSNNRNIFKYKYWLKNKVLPPRLRGL